MRRDSTPDVFTTLIYKKIFGCLLFLSLFISKADAQAPIVPPRVSNLTQVERSLINRISVCESGGNLKAKNKWSSASGEFQFIWGTWYHYGLEYWGDDFYSKNIWSTDNRELAEYVIRKYGTSDWNESKKCWGKT